LSWILCTALGSALPSRALQERAPLPHPAPVTDLLGDAAHERNGLERKRWVEELHGPTPSAEWQRIERENAERERLRRQALLDAGTSPRGAWTEIGSRNQAGHTRSVALGQAVRGAATTLYLGSANGGLWRGDTDGAGWTAVGDGLFGGIDAVVHLPGDPATLVVRRGPEVFWTEDEGLHWEPARGLEHLEQARAMVALEDPARTLLLLARWHEGARGEAGVLASTDRGRTFHLRWKAPGDGDGDLIAPPAVEGGPRTVFVVHKGELYASADLGHAFARRARVDGRSTAGELAAAAGGRVLYAALEVGSSWFLHRSADGGASFERVAELEDFWRALVACPEDPDVVLAGGMECRRSVDGGRTFEKVNAWGHYYGDPAFRLHADVRGLEALPDPNDPGASLVFVSTDGGTYLSRDRGASFRNLCLDGLGIGQIYSTLTSASDARLVLAGTQDQGYQRGRVETPLGRGSAASFEQLLSGDYGYLTSSDGTHELVYSSYPGFVLVQEGQDAPNLLYPWVDLPAGAQHAWMPPLVADPEDPEVFYLLGDYLYRYARRRGPYWGYRRQSTESFAAGGGRYLTALAFAPDPRRVYAANDAGRAWVSEDRAQTWRAVEIPEARGFRPTALVVDPADGDHALLGGAGYGCPGVFATRDGGAEWKPMAEGLPRTLLLDLAFATDGSGDAYAATEAGPYRWRASEGRWSGLMGVEAPATTYWCVEMLASGSARFGTYGRGIWDYDPRRDVSEQAEAR